MGKAIRKLFRGEAVLRAGLSEQVDAQATHGKMARSILCLLRPRKERIVARNRPYWHQENGTESGGNACHARKASAQRFKFVRHLRFSDCAWAKLQLPIDPIFSLLRREKPGQLVLF
jgi:hypothetical protein